MGVSDGGSGEPPGDTVGFGNQVASSDFPMTLSRARALCATSRKRIGVASLSGAERVTRLAAWFNRG